MESVIELDPNYFDSYVHLADAYQREGDVAKAIAAAERGVELSGRSPRHSSTARSRRTASSTSSAPIPASTIFDAAPTSSRP